MCQQIQKRKQIKFDNKYKEDKQENYVSTNTKKKTNRVWQQTQGRNTRE